MHHAAHTDVNVYSDKEQSREEEGKKVLIFRLNKNIGNKLLFSEKKRDLTTQVVHGPHTLY